LTDGQRIDSVPGCVGAGLLQNGQLGLLWEGKILFLDFSFPNLHYHTNNKDLCRFFKEIEARSAAARRGMRFP
jgi:hypothetical protein